MIAVLTASGLDYCRAHDGVRQEDETICDVADDLPDEECDLTPLLYELRQTPFPRGTA
jgi:hypothetical protein